MQFSIGMTVRSRGECFSIVEIDSLSTGEHPLTRLTLRSLGDASYANTLEVLYPIDSVEPDAIPAMTLEQPGRLPRFRLLHDVFRIQASAPTELLVGVARSCIRPEPYQYVPAKRALELPRPRLLLADDVGLGKTIEAGLVLQDLTARRRANRILVVCPAGIMKQWQDELESKFGQQFSIYDRDELHNVRITNEVGANPWAITPRVIASMDFIKRREGPFRELSTTRWDVVIIDEAHHLTGGRGQDDVTDRHRLAQWLSDASDALLLLTATPHDGYDESFSSLLSLLEPSLVMPDGSVSYARYGRHLVRRLKRHIRNTDGTPKFLERQVEPLPVVLSDAEHALQRAVLNQARDLEAFAATLRRGDEAEAVRLVATVLKKRAASSRAALASTVRTRRENLVERIDELELQRDHVRALKRGETITDEALARLERDAHRSYLATIRKLGRDVRRAESEQQALDEIEFLLDACQGERDSKIARLLTTIRLVHESHPHDKIILFSEYADTVAAITDTLTQHDDYRERFCVLTGGLTVQQRTDVLGDFATPSKLLLVATDAAGEGLNLHHHCHRIIHFELPWNPNRLEQRNGRIDRYGQSHIPIVGYLYAQGTYEGEVMSRLVDKVERQVRRLGSVGDVLGQIQADRIEQILYRNPEDLHEAVRQAEAEIDEEIAKVENTRLPQLLGDGSVDAAETDRAVDAAERGRALSIDLVDFLRRAVLAAGGRCQNRAGAITVDTPQLWLTNDVEGRYAGLRRQEPDSADVDPALVLDHDHPLIRAAVRWVKTSRFSAHDDHRLAYVLTSDVDHPDLIATFIVRIRDGEGHVQERLEPVRVTPELDVSTDIDADLRALDTQGEGNVDTDRIVAIFGDWWQSARERAEAEATRRANTWRSSIIGQRGITQQRFVSELEEWDRATRDAILGNLRQARTLFGEPTLPPAVRRKLRHHEERVRERREFLDRRMEFDPPVVEPVGVLLRVPATEGGA